MTSIFRDCWNYWGGCEPSTLDVALRTLAGAFGFGPRAVEPFLWLVIATPIVAVLVDPLPSSGRAILKRVAGALGLVGAYGWAATIVSMLVSMLDAAISLPPGWMMIAWFAVSIALLLAIAVLLLNQARRLVVNLRGGTA